MFSLKTRRETLRKSIVRYNAEYRIIRFTISKEYSERVFMQPDIESKTGLNSIHIFMRQSH